MTSIASILSAPRVSSEPIFVTGETRLYARTLTGAEVAAYLDSGDREKPLESGFRLILIGTCDEKGDRVFRDDELAAIRDFPFAITRQLIDGITRHNKLDKDGEDARKN